MKRIVYILLCLSFFYNANAVSRKNIKAYDELIDPRSKSHTLKNLYAFAEKIILVAIEHIEKFEDNLSLRPGEKILGPITISKIKNKLTALGKISSEVDLAFPVATATFENKIWLDKLRLNKIEATKERLSELSRLFKTRQFRRQIIDVEFEVLNKQYQKIVQAIKDLGGSVDNLPSEITLRDLEGFASRAILNY